MNSYWPAILLSALGHAVLVFFVIWGWQGSAQPPSIKKPAYVKATLVEMEPKAPKKVVPKSTSPSKPLPKKADDRKAKAEEKKKRDERKKQQAEQERKNQLAKKRAEEKKRLEELAREKKAQEQAREDERKRQQQLEQEALAQSIAKEQARLEAEQQATEDQAVVQSYIALIAQQVEQNWSRPPSARNGMQVVLRIQLVPTGQIIGVDVVDSSGDSAFDRSAVRAVKKTERFPELRNVSIRIFEQQFRVLNFIFEPKDLRQ